MTVEKIVTTPTPLGVTDKINEVITELEGITDSTFQGYWEAGETVEVGDVRYLTGRDNTGYVLECVQAGTTGTEQPIVSDEDLEQVGTGNSGSGSKVDDLGTLSNMTLAALLEIFDAWLDKHVGETGCSCTFIASAAAIIPNWMQGNFTGGIGNPGSSQATRYNLRIFVNTPDNSIITFLFTIGNSGHYIGTRNVNSANVTTWSKISSLFSGAVAASAQKLSNARKISLNGDVTGSVEFDGSKAVTIETTLSAFNDEGHFVLPDGSEFWIA